jgi:hypothetical protein
MPHSLQLLVGSLTLLWFFLMLADYGWECRKRRGLDSQLRPGAFEMRSERAEYESYSRMRYLAVIVLTYLNSAAVIDSEARDNALFVSPGRLFSVFFLAILFSAILLAIDSYWDRRTRRGLTGIPAGLFWSYFFLRYPALILATITATKMALQS